MQRIFLGLILSAVLCACGSKGPLYHPSDKPAPKPAAKAQVPSSDTKVPQ